MNALKEHFARRPVLSVLTTVAALLVILVGAAALLLSSQSEMARSLASVGSEDGSKFIHLETLRIDSFGEKKQFLISNTDSYSRLKIENTLAKVKLALVLSCDHSFHHVGGDPSPQVTQRDLNLIPLEKYSFLLSPTKSREFLIGPSVRRCELSYFDRQKNTPERSSSFEILSETQAFPWLADLVRYQESCNSGGAQGRDPLDQFFLDKSMPQLACPRAVDEMEYLETPESGFLAKTEMLLGQKLPLEFISQQNPYAELDFSKAPRLKAIYLATLVYRADFYGTVMARLLKYHADRGTLVNIITTGYMMLDKDKALLFPLAAQNGNIRLQEFKYYDPSGPFSRVKNYISNKYRDMHVKLLITLSDETPSQNAVVFGGRNIHDGFLFKTQPDYSKYPKLVQYGTDDSFVHWNDFEMKVTSRELALKTAAQLEKLLKRDTTTQTLMAFASEKGERALLPQGDNLFRHFITLPYSDDYALEDLYVSLIDSAQKSIHLSSPYLRPTNKILNALLRAAKRGVEIVIQTRIELTGDTQAWLYEEVNKESINRLFRETQIYHWKENSILHSKFILVDGKVALIGSVNLSRRSFIQDIENGYLIRSEAVVSKMESLFKSYLKKSATITAEEDRKFFPSLLIKMLQNQF